MWFRALRPYRLPNRLGIDAEELERRLQTRTFSNCTPAQASSLGWVPALDDAASVLVHAAGPYWMVRLKREEKLLPATVVREQANERCAQIAKAQGRKVSRRERLAVTDEVTQDLLPRAFSRSSSIRAIIADQAGWIWIDSSSAGATAINPDPTSLISDDRANTAGAGERAGQQVLCHLIGHRQPLTAADLAPLRLGNLRAALIGLLAHYRRWQQLLLTLEPHHPVRPGSMNQHRSRIIKRWHPPQAARLSRRAVRESAGLKTPLKLLGVDAEAVG